MKKVLSIFVALAMVVSLLSGTTVFAAKGKTGNGDEFFAQKLQYFKEKAETYEYHTKNNKFLALIGSPDPNAVKIYNAQDLNNIRNNLNSSFVLMNDIDLSSWGNWIPISNFSGTFDGQGKKIKNLKVILVENSKISGGLFDSVIDGTIKNLEIENADITAERSGGIVGSLVSSEVDNCSCSGKISILSKSFGGDSVAGGIVGYITQMIPHPTSVISNCHSNVSISGSILGLSTSGIVGGGIVGAINPDMNANDSGGSNATILHSYSIGQIDVSCAGSGNNNVIAGGIIGYASGGTYDDLVEIEVEKCFSRSNLNASKKSGSFVCAGGIIGSSGVYLERTIVNECYYIGSLAVDGYSWINAGGMIGFVSSGMSIIDNCHNMGRISSSAVYNARAGGGIGLSNRDVMITHFLNDSPVKVDLSITENYSDAGIASGVIGKCNKSIAKDCFNNGPVSIESIGHAGSIAAGIIACSESFDLENCYNSGDIFATITVGGIIAEGSSWNDEASIIENCYNKGNVFSQSTNGSNSFWSAFVGGIAGQCSNSLSVNNCNNFGGLSGYYVGGIIGVYGGKSIALTNCTNNGQIITVPNESYAKTMGGIIASSSSATTTIRNCNNNADIQVEYFGGIPNNVCSGGIIGSVSGDLIEVSNCKNAGIVSYFDDTDRWVQTSNMYSGGIIGITTCTNSFVEKSSQTGKVEALSSKNTWPCYAGGIIGYAESGCTIVECSVAGDVKALTCAGGVLGYLFSEAMDIRNVISSSHFEGNITAATVGGIIGGGNKKNNDRTASVSITDCSSVGTKNGQTVGGIIGFIYEDYTPRESKWSIEIVNAKSQDVIDGIDIAGGIIGSFNGACTINRCSNEGRISAKTVGGILGRIVESDINVLHSYNLGAINAEASSGGLVGRTRGSKINVKNSYNSGNIKVISTDALSVGGLIGADTVDGYGTYLLNEISIKDSYNTGNLYAESSKDVVVSGLSPASETGNSYNAGDITVKTTASATIGGITSRTWHTTTDCKNWGAINVEARSYLYVGGIVGILSDAYNISSCDNDGDINTTIAENANIGGILGICLDNFTVLELSNCHNNGHIETKAEKSSHAAGIAGNSNKEINCFDCSNTGNITSSSNSSDSYACGITMMGQTIQDCKNSGAIDSSSIDGRSYAGGLVATRGQIDACNSTGDVFSISSSGFSYAGGLAGTLSNGSVKNSCSAGSIAAYSTKKAAYAGGIVGYAESHANITISKSNCVLESSSIESNSFAGGISGYSSASIVNCYTKSDVHSFTGKDNMSACAGGLVGGNYGTINTSYSNSTLSADSTELYGFKLIGGLAANNNSSSIKNCYFNYELISDLYQYSGLTTAEMKNSNKFVGFDFDTVWGINPTFNDGMPFLRVHSPEVSSISCEEPYIQFDITVNGNREPFELIFKDGMFVPGSAVLNVSVYNFINPYLPVEEQLTAENVSVQIELPEGLKFKGHEEESSSIYIGLLGDLLPGVSGNIEEEIVFVLDEASAKNFKIIVTLSSISAKDSQKTFSINIIDRTTPPNIQIGRDTWSFENQTKRIDYSYYEYFFGAAKAVILKDDYDNGTGGQCFGMVSSAININNDQPPVSDFLNSPSDLSGVPQGSYNSEIRMTAENYIKYGQVFQNTTLISKEKERNKNSLLELYRAVVDYENGVGPGVNISVHGRYEFKDAGHALWGISVEDFSDRSEINVYDCNHPNETRKLILRKHYGSFISWEYTLNDGLFGAFKTVWGTGKRNASISFNTLSNSYYGILKSRSYEKGTFDKSHYLVAATAPNFKLSTEQGTVTSIENYIPENSSVLTPILATDTLIDPNSTYVQENDVDPDPQKAHFYWTDSGSNLLFFDNEENTEIYVVGQENGIRVNAPAYTSVEFDVNDLYYNAINIKARSLEAFSIAFLQARGNGVLDSIIIEGSTTEQVEAVETTEGIRIVGLNNFLVTFNSEGETISQYVELPFSEISATIQIISGSGTPRIVIIREDASDDRIVAADKAALTWDVIKNANALQNAVTSNLTLPTSGASGTTITWTSDNSTVISAIGLVTRPAFVSGDASVRLTATISKGAASDTVTFDLTVLKLPATYPVTVSSIGIGPSGGGNYESGATVNISAGTPPAGMQFKNWTSSPTMTFDDLNSADTSFTMIAQAVTVTANFEPIPPTVTSVVVNPSTVTVQKGTSYQFSATVIGKNNPDHSVTWTVEGGSGTTAISKDGKLSVDASETAETLTVKANSSVAGYTDVYGTAIVIVSSIPVIPPTVTSVTVAPDTITLSKGDSYKFSAIVVGDNNPSQSVAWTVEGGALGTSIASDGTLTIAENETAEALTVRATSTVTGHTNISGIANVTVMQTTPSVFTITFDANGGGVSPETARTGTDGKLSTLPTPTRSGSYRFDGWFTIRSGGTQVTTSTVFTSDATIYAHWTYTGSSTPSNPSSGSEVIPPATQPPLADPWDNPYNDVADTDWFYEAVRFVTETDLMNGTSADKFSPDVTMSRAMLVTVLWRLESGPEVEGMYADFADVTQGSWYEMAVGWAAKNGIVLGFPGGFFKPDDPVTREQAVTILYRYAALKKLDVSKSANVSQLTDMKDISDWALAAMKWAVAEGIVQGRTADTIVPKGTSTRAEVATVFKRYIKDFLSKRGSTN